MRQKPVYLQIGDFVIGCASDRPGVPMKIPPSGMAFYHPGECEEDFRLRADDSESSTGGVRLFGSDGFAVPTFLYQRENGDYDWFTKDRYGRTGLAFRISRDWTAFTLYEDQTGTEGERAFLEFGSLFSYAVLNRGACVLHGVVMEYKGMGILVTAPSGTGKTTHTRMWREREHALILNGDRCLCRKIDGKWYAYGMPWAGSSGEFMNRRVPVAAVVCLRQDRENHIRAMSRFEGTIAMMQRIFAPVWKGELRAGAFDLTEDLASSVPVLELGCRPDFEAVDVLKEAVLRLGETE